MAKKKVSQSPFGSVPVGHVTRISPASSGVSQSPFGSVPVGQMPSQYFGGSALQERF